MSNRIIPPPRRVLWVAISLILATAASSHPLRAVDSRDVNVVNIPTVNARQSGAWDVGIDHARKPFQKGFFFHTHDGQATGSYEFVVPAGYRLVIEQVTALTTAITGQSVASVYRVTTTVDDVIADHWVPAASATNGDSVGCEQVRLYADPGTQVQVFAFRTVLVGEVATAGSISGYLIPTP